MTNRTDFNRSDPASNNRRSVSNFPAETDTTLKTNGTVQPPTPGPDVDADPVNRNTESKLMWRSVPQSREKWSGVTLRRQLLVRIVPGVLLPLTCASLIGYLSTSQKASQGVENLLKSEALVAGEVAAELVNEIEISTALIAANPLVLSEIQAAAEQVELEELKQLSIEELEQRFADTLLLKVNEDFNDYLKESAQIAGFAEVFFTDKNGFNIAYSQRTSDFVQRDESWWQRGKNAKGQILIPEFDQSANVQAVDVVQPIKDPESGEFMGVIKAVVPTTYFNKILNFIEDFSLLDTQQAQVIAFNQERQPVVLTTFTSQGVGENEKVMGGNRIIERAFQLSELYQRNRENVETAAQQVNFPIIIIKHERKEGTQFLLETTLVQQDRQYFLTTIPLTDWVMVTSVEDREIVEAGQDSALLFGSLILTVGAIAIAISFQIARQITKPIDQLANTADRVAAGDLEMRASVEGSAESRILAGSFNNLVSRLQALLNQQTAEANRARLVNEIVAKMRRSLQIEDILKTTVNELRSVLKTDRMIVYRFHDDWNGTIVAESVIGGWREILGETVNDPFREGLIDRYRNGRVRAMNDIYAEGLTDCHRDILEGLQVRASIVAPVVYNDRLMGLLCAHHCSDVRVWEATEIDLVRQISMQLGFALEQGYILEQEELSRLQAEALSEEQRQQKESIQMQLLNLLDEVEGASRGDLTVRADVTAGDIGTVADFFNSIVESLRQIVTQVKQSTRQVNASLGENEGAISQLADEALLQAEESTRTLDSIQEMTRSIREVAHNARQAALVARTASATAKSGGVAMDSTAANILALRETVAETAKKVKRLGEASQQISKVVSLINQIALQTNLLAINAGIEAARAGEEGQGFAVVAEEVGELAARSASATKDIERIVENIQLETGQVVEAMEQSTSQVVEGTRLVEGAKQSLEQIVAESSQIDELVQSISEATGSQVATSQVVSALMQQIAKVSTRTSISSRQVSEALRETVEIAQQLQASVGTFKVNSDQ